MTDKMKAEPGLGEKIIIFLEPWFPCIFGLALIPSALLAIFLIPFGIFVLILLCVLETFIDFILGVKPQGSYSESYYRVAERYGLDV